MPGLPKGDILWLSASGLSGKLGVVRSSHSARRSVSGSLLRLPHNTVALIAPIDWEELDEGVRSDQLNTATLPRRLRSLKKDPWAGIDTLRQGITLAAQRKIGMRG